MAGKTGYLVSDARYLSVPRGGRRDDHRSQLRRVRIPAARPTARPHSRPGAPARIEHQRGVRPSSRGCGPVGRTGRSRRCRRSNRRSRIRMPGSSVAARRRGGSVLSAWHRDVAGGRRVVRRHGAAACAGAGRRRRPRGGDLMILDVILPTFNREALLARTLDSLRAARRPRRACRCACSSSTTRQPMARGELVRRAAAGWDGRLQYLFVPTPGKAARAERRNRRDRRRSHRPHRRRRGSGSATGSSPSGGISGPASHDVDFIGGKCLPLWGAPRPAWLGHGISRRDWLGRSGPAAEGHGRGLSRAS